MIHKLKFRLLLIEGLCYLTSVFELDKDECKENYAKEQCFKVCCTKATDSKAVFQIATLQPALLTSCNYHFPITATATYKEDIFAGQFISPDKIFIRHGALLI